MSFSGCSIYPVYMPYRGMEVLSVGGEGTRKQGFNTNP